MWSIGLSRHTSLINLNKHGRQWQWLHYFLCPFKIFSSPICNFKCTEENGYIKYLFTQWMAKQASFWSFRLFGSLAVVFTSWKHLSMSRSSMLGSQSNLCWMNALDGIAAVHGRLAQHFVLLRLGCLCQLQLKDAAQWKSESEIEKKKVTPAVFRNKIKSLLCVCVCWRKCCVGH